MYDAKLHPEQYSNTLSAAQISQLHKSIHYVCGLSVETLAESSKFPEGWLFKHRWSKGKKDAPTTLPNGSKFVFLTVGGRTSAIVPSVQKKTGPVTKDVDIDGETDGVDAEEEPKAASKKGTKRKKAPTADEAEVNGDQADSKLALKSSRSKKSSTSAGKESTGANEKEKPEAAVKTPSRKKGSIKHEDEVVVGGAANGEDQEMNDDSSAPANKGQKDTAKQRTGIKPKGEPKSNRVKTASVKEERHDRRRSGRVSSQQVSYAE